MAKAIAFSLITPNAVVFEGEATFVLATGTEGEIGILADHTPYLTALKPGVLRADIAVNGSAERMEIATSAGFMQALPTKITVLVDTALKADAVDAEAARAERTAAQERLKAAGHDRVQAAREQEIIDFANAKLALARL
jgi:F-type H+-transporting ATPase subunit epsilon